jgi:predicted PurR-regulated permease PerM/methanogenic corrinoid protein MtbC1
MPVSKSNPVSSAIFGIYRLLIIVCVLVTLYFAQTIVIPLTLAGLLTFLLSPFVARLEKWIGRIFSILFVVIVVFSMIGFTGYVFTRQLILFGGNFKNYNENIEKKLESFHLPQWEIFNRLGHTFKNFKEGLLGESDTNNANSNSEANNNNVSPIDVKLIDFSSNFTNFLESLFGSFFKIFWMIGIVLLLVIFMLLNREDIRGRIIKLVGQHRISSTTIALDDASERVFCYLYSQFIVNIGFGICVATGLYLIGIPSFFLWGFFASILRFIPYIGPWIAAIIPIALSFIITDTWLVPTLTISFFIILEIITAYIIEPYYYGAGTGISSFALILAAIFWTWLWGPLGLVLSTPLTVCLVVIGQYVTNMNFLRVLLSQEEALTPTEEFYHRLLSFDSNESMDFVESYLKKTSLVSLYDTVIIPVITQTEVDYHQELIDGEKKEELYQSIREIVDFLNISEQKEISETSQTNGSIICIPAKAIRDELGVNMLTQLLNHELLDVYQITRLNIKEVFELVEKNNPDVVCIAVVAPFVLSHTRYLCTQLHQRMPKLPIVIGLWGFSKVASETIDKLTSAGAAKIVFSLSQTIEALKSIKSR